MKLNFPNCSLLLIPLTLLAGCLSLSSGHPTYTFPSPDQRSEIRIEQYNCGFADCAIRVVLKRGWRYAYLTDRSDCALNFAHAAWHEAKVSVFVDGGHCGAIKTAFDIANWSNLSFSATEEWMREAVIADYAVSPEELQANQSDVFKWATYPGDGKPRRSVQEFQKRFTPKSSGTDPAHKTTPLPRPR
jgi:hypothetical protein